MLTAIREVQIPPLAAMLLGACLAKAWRALRPHAHPARSDPADLFPADLRRPIMVLVPAAELGLRLGLIGTAVKFGRDWPALPATVVRTGTALFFLVAVGALNEMRQRRPDAGCGCFGELSGTPIGLRTIARPGLPCASAVATLGLPPLRMPSSSAEAELWLASSQWRRYAGQVSARSPSDGWREGCWRFVVYPGYARGRPVDIVFAVYLQSRRPAVRAPVLDATPTRCLAPP